MSLLVELDHVQGGFRAEMAFRTDGRLTCLFGRSGAGKTTLVNAIAGLIRPARGRIEVDGAVLVDTEAGIFVPKHRRRIGYVFQEGRLFPHLNVRQNLLFGRWFQRGLASAGPDLAQVVALLGIEPLLGRRPATLSGGEKQRVAIGRALLARPRLLLMDEPLAALDELRKQEILPYIERLRDEAGIPIVYVSHAVAEVARLADTVVMLESGRVVATGPARDVLAAPELALFGERDAGAVLEGRVIGRDEAYGLCRVETPAGALWLPSSATIGATLRLLVPAREVMIATERPSGISALNVLAGTVAAVSEPRAGSHDVTIVCGEARLLARVTRKSVAELDLAPGREVYALIKSMSLDRSGG